MLSTKVKIVYIPLSWMNDVEKFLNNEIEELETLLGHRVIDVKPLNVDSTVFLITYTVYNSCDIWEEQDEG